jgi:hypothetical protein
MDDFDPGTSFGYDASKRYDASSAGVPVDGIEPSPDMVDRLREKPGGVSAPEDR